MHVTLDVVHAHAHPRKRSYRTEEERKRAEVERREEMLKRGTSLLAQLLCPLAPLFSLPGLTEHWYVKHGPDGQIVRSKPDPPLIIAAGSIALAMAVLANIAILFRLIETHPRFFSSATMTFLSVHMVVNLVALSIFGAEHAHPDGYVLSTAFWLTAASGCVALAVVACLLVDGLATKWYTRGGTGVSGKQRSLILTFDVFCSLLLVGSVCYRYLISDVTYLDTVYFCIQSLLTVGFGDIVPDTTGAQIFSLFFNTVGILTFALLVAFTRETALEAIQNEYKSQEQILLSRLRQNRRNPGAARAGFLAHALAFLTCGLYHTPSQQAEEQDVDAGETDRRESEETETDDGEVQGEEKVRIEEQRYEEAIAELKKERDREFRSEVVVSLTLFLVFWLVGAAAFSALEGWSFWIGFYFVFVMSSSIGYGDYSPATQGGRAFFCVWALVGAGTLTVFFSVLADAYTSRFKETFQRSVLNRLWIKLTRPPRDAAAEIEREEERAAFPSPPQGSRAGTPDRGEGSGKVKEHADTAGRGGAGDEQREKLLAHLVRTRQHLDHLILADGEAKNEHVDAVVRRVMGRGVLEEE
ncbi:Potassium channel [Rhodotorula kratochvilovae]